MTPLQFLARLSALVPPPRHPLIRFYGVCAPHSAWRMGVVSLSERDPGTDASTTRIEPPALAEPQATEQPVVGSKSQLQQRTGIDWATLLRRVHDLDALACRCGGRLSLP
jgi:hypothetical protein